MSGRVETGKVQIGDDWPGVFIRGDSALHFGAVMKAFLGGNDNPINRAVLTGLAATLLKAEARNGVEAVALARADLHQSALRAAREAALREAAEECQRLKGNGWGDVPPEHPYDRGYIRACEILATRILALIDGEKP